MRSQAQHRRLVNKAKEETAQLKERLTAKAGSYLPQRKEIYELLEIVTAITGDIEDAGDDIVNGFNRYNKGRQSLHGGSYICDLIRAVIHFINRWGRAKDRLGDLKQKQQDLINKSQDLLPPPPPSQRADPAGQGPTTGVAVEEGNSPQQRLPSSLSQCSRGAGTQPDTWGAAGPIGRGVGRQRPGTCPVAGLAGGAAAAMNRNVPSPSETRCAAVGLLRCGRAVRSRQKPGQQKIVVLEVAV
jgi:hypothetical protein